MSPAVDSTEVRSCANCAQPSVTLVSDWKQTVWGASTGSSTRDYRCQSCGARFTIHPVSKQIGLVVAGVLTLPILAGLVILWIAWSRSRPDANNPIVVGAPAPEVRYRDGPPLRSCGSCGGTATAARITRHTHNGVPTGIEYEYECAQCKKGFTIESAWGHGISIFGGALLLGIGVTVLSTVESALARYGWGVSISLVGVFLLAQVFKRMQNRLRNPAQHDYLRP